MSIILIFGVSAILLITINANLIKLYLDDKTKYKCDIYDQGKVLLLCVFFGIFLLLFQKQLKRYRKRLYLEEKLRKLNEHKFFAVSVHAESTYKDIEEKIFSVERL